MVSTFRKLFFGLSITILNVSLANDATAQRRGSRDREMSKPQVKRVVERVENRVDVFVKNYDRSLDRSRVNGTSREDWLNRRANDLENATDELRREFDRRDRWAENREEVRRCLNIASDIDHNMRNYRFGRQTETNWARVRYELNTLANVYNLPRVAAMAYN